MLDARQSHGGLAGHSPDTRRGLTVVPLIGDKRYYGEAPGRVRCGPLVRASRLPFPGGMRVVVGRRSARLAGGGFAVSLTWLKAGLRALRQIVHMNWQEMWSRDWPRR